jgi:hypothetical protein
MRISELAACYSEVGTQHMIRQMGSNFQAGAVTIAGGRQPRMASNFQRSKSATNDGFGFSNAFSENFPLNPHLSPERIS